MHIMIDLETMGIRPSSAIVSIGAVHFNETEILSEFHVPISLASSVELGLTTDQSTVNWWMKQSSEARSSWQREDAATLPTALEQFCAWVRKVSLPSQIRPWGNGADFDLVLLKSSFEVISADPPWRYYNHRCYRTVKGLFPVPDVPRQGTHHNALDDAKHQARVLQSICKAYDFKLS